MKFIYAASLFAMLTGLLISCHTNNEKMNSTASDAVAQTAHQKSEARSPGNFIADTTLQQSPVANNLRPDWDKKIIKNANILLEVKDYRGFNNTIHRELKRFGAYVASEEQTSSIYRIENVITVKVPVDQFEDAVHFLTPDTLTVHEKRISSDDVTSQVVDTKSRIQAKKEVRERYLELLRQAKSTKDILAVQNEINSIQEELEAAEGRLNYMSHSSAFSTITLRYYQQLNATEPQPQEPGFVNKIYESFKTGGAWLGDLLVALIALWPLWIAVAFLLLFMKRMRVSKLKLKS